MCIRTYVTNVRLNALGRLTEGDKVCKEEASYCVFVNTTPLLHMVNCRCTIVTEFKAKECSCPGEKDVVCSEKK